MERLALLYCRERVQRNTGIITREMKQGCVGSTEKIQNHGGGKSQQGWEGRIRIRLEELKSYTTESSMAGEKKRTAQTPRRASNGQEGIRQAVHP